MKKIINTLLVCWLTMLTTEKLNAQSDDSTLIERYKLDFSVPDMPAFKALGTDPSNILRPSDVKKFSFMLSPFYSNGKAIIPRNFALEFAPWKLASKHWTLHDYDVNWVKRSLYRSSFSIGAIQDSLQFSSRLAVGYRISVLSRRADIYRAAEIRNKVFSGDDASMQNAWNAYDKLVTDFLIVTEHNGDRSYYTEHKTEFYKFIDEALSDKNAHYQTYHTDFIALVQALAAMDVPADNASAILETLAGNVDNFIEEYQKNNWNASRFDAAVAWVASSDDSLLSNAQYNNFTLWATWALRVHKGGQLLIGINTALPRSENKDSVKFNFTGNLRYYLGTQDFRGFLEAQYKYQRYDVNERSLLINLGAEFRVSNSIWIVAGAGVNNYLTEQDPFSKLVSSIDLRYGFNRQRK